nr:reverse transcriptase domain-containing protein [Tanacetum cinerariifolium]
MSESNRGVRPHDKILPIIAEKVHQEKVQQEKLKVVKARLNFEETSRHSESGTPSRRKSLKERFKHRHARSMSKSPEPRRGHSKSSRDKGPERRTMFKILEKGVSYRLGDKEKNVSAHSRDSRHRSNHSSHEDTKSCYQSSHSRETEIASEKHRIKRESSRRTEALSESKGIVGGHWKSIPKKQKSSVEDDLSQPWILPIIAEKVHQEKVQQEKLKVVKARLNFEETSRHSESGTPSRRKSLKERFKHRHARSQAIAAAETLKAATRVLAPEKHKLLPRNIVSKENPRDKRKHYQKVKPSYEDIGSQYQRSRSRALRTTCPNYGGKDQAKVAKKGEASKKDKPLPILMVQTWESLVRQKITQSFSSESVISFSPLGEKDGTEGPMIIETKMGGRYVHRMKAKGQENSGLLKFPVTGETVTLRSIKIIPLECTMISGPGVPQPVINQVTEEKIQVAIHPEYPKQTIAIGSTLMEKGRKELCGLLRRNLNIFAWKPTYMTGVPRYVAEHRLNIHKGCLPVRQKKKGQAPKRNKVICEELKKLVEADIMKEVYYHSWLSNPVMVKKHDGS